MTAGGGRCFVRFEQVCQLATHGLDNIINGIMSWCINKHVSEGSNQMLFEMFDPTNGSKVNLVMTMVEISDVADGLKTIC